MNTTNTQFKNFQISKEEAKNIKGGFADIGMGGGTGSNGFVSWDDIEPRDDGLVFSGVSISAIFLKFKKQK